MRRIKCGDTVSRTNALGKAAPDLVFDEILDAIDQLAMEIFEIPNGFEDIVSGGLRKRR